MDAAIRLGAPPQTLAALAIIGAVAALALSRATRGKEPAPLLRFTPRLLAPQLHAGLLALSALALAPATAPLPPVWALALHGGGVALIHWGVRRLAVTIYRRRMRRQVQHAVTALAQHCTGAAALFPSFRAVAATLPWPLGDEWRWVIERVNQPLPESVAIGGGRRYVGHADALRALAAQTLLDEHAEVLDHIAAWYEYGQESVAGARLRRLAELLERRDRAYRSALTAIGRVRGEAWIISGAMALVALWLTVRAPDQVIGAFQTPWGGLAALWFLAWLLAPPLCAALLVQRPR